MINLSAIGPTIKKLRKSKNISQITIERKINCSRTWISKIENGHHVPTLESLVRIGEAIEIPAWKILRYLQKDTNENNR
jgi:transcriptional regulator with XRE-family HTH domain